ncbi:hypothetical protein X975_06256, partial [Stegodyphus mimosarum]
MLGESGSVVPASNVCLFDNIIIYIIYLLSYFGYEVMIEELHMERTK